LELLAAPSELLAEIIEVDPAAYAALVDEARLANDPEGELRAIADSWLSASPRGGADTEVGPRFGVGPENERPSHRCTAISSASWW